MRVFPTPVSVPVMGHARGSAPARQLVPFLASRKERNQRDAGALPAGPYGSTCVPPGAAVLSPGPRCEDAGLGHGTRRPARVGDDQFSNFAAAAAGVSMGMHTPRWWRAWIGRIKGQVRNQRARKKAEDISSQGRLPAAEKPSPQGEGVTADAVTDEVFSFRVP